MGKASTTKRLLSIHEVARSFKISKATANYYTNLGLLRIADKQGNKRLYDLQETERTLGKIKSLRTQGYTLKLIQRTFLHNDRAR